MPDPSSDPSGIQALGLLFTALGLSSVSGLRAYFPLLAVAIGSNVSAGNGSDLITLSKPFQALGSWWFIAALVVMALGEFLVDKVPGLDHVSDAVHTVVRPLAGALVMAGISNPVSDRSPLAAAIVGALLALSVHTVKAASRPAVTATTAGIGNPVVSLVEDILVAVVSLLALIAPILAVAVLAVLAVSIALLIRAGWRRLRGRRAAPRPVPNHGGSPPGSGTATWPLGGGAYSGPGSAPWSGSSGTWPSSGGHP